MRILIDGDGCPVAGLGIKAGKARGIHVILVWDEAHQGDWPGVETVTAPTGRDSTDFAIVNKARPGDIVITQDYGLAAMCLGKGAYPINQDGMAYTEENMDGLLLSRHLAGKARRAGGRVKGPKKRGPSQDHQFLKALEALMDRLQGEEGAYR